MTRALQIVLTLAVLAAIVAVFWLDRACDGVPLHLRDDCRAQNGFAP